MAASPDSFKLHQFRYRRNLINDRLPRNFLLCSAAYLAATTGAASNDVVNRQDDDRPDYRGDETGRLAWLVPAQRASDPTGEKRSSDTKQHRDNDPSGIAPWDDQLCESAYHQANDKHP
jgi:hypothetical protein